MSEREDYLSLRWTSRDALDRVDVPSNPGWGDDEIVNSIRQVLELPAVKIDGTKDFDKGYIIFRDALITTIEETKVEIPEPKTEISNILNALSKAFRERRGVSINIRFAEGLLAE